VPRRELPRDHGSEPLERKTLMSVFEKQGVYWIDYYVNGHRKPERIAIGKFQAEIVLHK
jgi:hypothetical protein